MQANERARHDAKLMIRVTNQKMTEGAACAGTRQLHVVEKAEQGNFVLLQLEFYNSMLDRYPVLLNPTALWFWGAWVLFPAPVPA
jgi:hypothetical protein